MQSALSGPMDWILRDMKNIQYFIFIISAPFIMLSFYHYRCSWCPFWRFIGHSSFRMLAWCPGQSRRFSYVYINLNCVFYVQFDIFMLSVQPLFSFPDDLSRSLLQLRTLVMILASIAPTMESICCSKINSELIRGK